MRLNSVVASHRESLLLVVFWVFHTASSAVWLGKDVFGQPQDPYHYVNSLHYFKAMSSLSLPNMGQIASKYWPPFSHVLPLPFYFVLGYAPDVAALIQGALFMAILLFSVYGIGRQLASKKAGLLAAFLVAVFPGTTLLGRQFMADLPLTAVVSLSLYLLLRSESFRSRTYSLLFGVVLGLGFLTKTVFPLFVAGPLGFVLLRSVHSLVKEHQRRSVDGVGHLASASESGIGKPVEGPGALLRNSMYALSIAALLTSMWYVPYWDHIVSNIRMNASYKLYAGNPVPFPLIQNASFPLFVFSVASLVCLVSSGSLERKKLVFLLLWLSIPCVVYSFQSNQEYRYLLPAGPALALISAIAIDSAPYGKGKVVLSTLLVAFGLTYLFVSSYGVVKWQALETKVGAHSVQLVPAPITPRTRAIRIPEALEIISATRDPDKRITILPVPYSGLSQQLRMYIARDAVESPDAPAEAVDVGVFPGQIDFGAVLSTDYILYLRDTETGKWTSTGIVRTEFDRLTREGLSQLQNFIQENADTFEDVGRLNLGSDTELLIYRNVRSSKNRPSAVRALDVIPAAISFKPGEKMDVLVTLKNRSSVGQLARAQVYLDGARGVVPWKARKGPVLMAEATPVRLSPGEQNTVVVAGLVPDKAGCYELTARVLIETGGAGYHHSDFAYSTSRVELVGAGGAEGQYCGVMAKRIQESNRIRVPRSELRKAVLILGMLPDRTSYKPGEKMTVNIVVVNRDKVPHDMFAVVYLDVAGGKEAWDEPAEKVIKTRTGLIHLDSWERKAFPVSFKVFNAPGKYSLSIGVPVCDEDGRCSGSDNAWYMDTITVTKP